MLDELLGLSTTERVFFYGCLMTTEVASLAISIDSTNAKKSAADLNGGTTAGEKTEATIKSHLTAEGSFQRLGAGTVE